MAKKKITGPTPEQIRAFRDTWQLGIHSYLAYLRDRPTVARDLLTDTGSIFVQIGDENSHSVDLRRTSCSAVRIGYDSDSSSDGADEVRYTTGLAGITLKTETRFHCASEASQDLAGPIRYQVSPQDLRRRTDSSSSHCQSRS